MSLIGRTIKTSRLRTWKRQAAGRWLESNNNSCHSQPRCWLFLRVDCYFRICLTTDKRVAKKLNMKNVSFITSMCCCCRVPDVSVLEELVSFAEDMMSVEKEIE